VTPQELISKLYEYNEHIDSDNHNAVSVTTLLGPMWKAKLYLEKAERDVSLVKRMYKRSSMIGSAIHSWAEKALGNDKSVTQEVYKERFVEVEGCMYTISGSCDLIVSAEDKDYIADWKSGYGKERGTAALDKDRMQMSMYRWLNQDDYDLDDTAYSIFISQSNNIEIPYPVVLEDLDDVQFFIEEKLFAISQTDSCDCFDNVKYNPCNYCDFVCENRKSK